MRLPPIEKGALSALQKQVMDSIASSRSGNLAGPFVAWLHAPDAADLAEQLGAHLRYRTSLDPNVTEAAILTVAASCDCDLERQIHEPIARQNGVPESLIVALRSGDPLEPDGSMSIAVLAARQIVETNRLDDSTYAACIAAFGEAGTVELILFIGYYVLVALTINAFQIDITDAV